MSKTLSDLRAEARIYLDEAVQTDFLDSEINIAINRGYQNVVTAVISIFEDYYITHSETTTVANQQEYVLPNNFYKMKRVEANYTPDQPNSVRTRLFPVNLENVKTRLNESGNPLAGGNYYIIGNDIGLVPVPTIGGQNALQIWYMPMQSDLSDSNSNVNIPYSDRYSELIIKYAVAVLLRKGQQAEAVATQYMREFETGILTMKNELAEREDDDMKTIDSIPEDIAFDSGGW